MTLLKSDDKCFDVDSGSRLIEKTLEEDEYIEKLEEIITRDYFPELPKLKAKAEYLEALEKNDHAKIRLLQMKHRRKDTNRDNDEDNLLRSTSPSSFESPALFKRVNRETQSRLNRSVVTMDSSAGLEVDHDQQQLSLDKFLANYTSEDNSSFSKLQEAADLKHWHKYRWVYDAEKQHLTNYDKEGRALPPIEKPLAIEGAHASKALDTWTYKSKNSVLWVPDAVPFTEEEDVKRRRIAEEKQIVFENTRFSSSNLFNSAGQLEQVSLAVGTQAAVNKGKLDAQGNEIFKAPAPAGFGGQKFSMVVTPSPMPGEGPDASPLMTWGEIEGTPLALDGIVGTPGGPAFRMPEETMRDKIAQELTESMSKQHRQAKRKAINNLGQNVRPTPKFGSVRTSELLLSMSPAARRLATNKLGIRRSSDRRLQESYTPSPRRFKDKTPRIVSSVYRQTPSVRQSDQPAGGSVNADSDSPKPCSITDNLLNINVAEHRLRAEDFFK